MDHHMSILPVCPDCKHLLENNPHGFDQNDGWLEWDSDGEPKLIHSGRCTYCKECRAGR